MKSLGRDGVPPFTGVKEHSVCGSCFPTKGAPPPPALVRGAVWPATLKVAGLQGPKRAQPIAEVTTGRREFSVPKKVLMKGKWNMAEKS